MTWTERIVQGRFEDRTVVVTGSGAGIGRATALRIAREGGRVVASDLDGGRLADLSREAEGLDVTTVTGDVSDDAHVAAIVAACEGRVDGLANNAGIMDRFAPVHEVDDETWERVFRVNVTGVMKPSRALVPLMLAAGAGSIVNVASEAGFRGSCAGVAYTASKHAVIGMTRSGAVMYGPSGIRVNAVCPGAVRTSIVAEWGSTFAQARLGPLLQANVGSVAEPEHLAAVIAYLLSDDGVNVNGAIVASDGGWSAI